MRAPWRIRGVFQTRYHATQDRRIKRMVELAAFAAIGKSWRALGYPFASLTHRTRRRSAHRVTGPTSSRN
ncbi:glycosyl transferase family protein [Caballeronia choica]|jgi:hypothetical protein|uniref:Glycosyl transferase family protein n=1 Tax=Caballeronia choica TaxID=326476 RepID=A0A158KY19_9BURK|nr:glycosyl transferase family protein [Caballeronia choica]